MEPQAEWYLVEALANARASLGVRPDYEARQGSFSHFAGVLAGYRYLGVITQDEENVWNRKMLIALGYAPPDPGPPGTAQSMYLGDPKKRPAAEPVSQSPPVFVRSVPGPDREFEVFDGRLRVIAVEIYDTAASVRWRASPAPDISLVFPTESAALEEDVAGLEKWAADELRKKAQQRMRMMRLYKFHLADDVGTDYVPMGSSHGGRDDEMSGEARFLPAPPSTAALLIFTWLTLEIPVPLS